ncbi:MAG: hypothetical protein HY885_14625 [Deltaproteobacteria bacterium]|nr:hypothetical protein [Deltaproteobacteria bacterium]
MAQDHGHKKDVLGNILQGQQHGGSIQGLDELTMMIERYASHYINKENNPSSPPHTPPLPNKTEGKRSPVKRKSTHYLTKEVFRELNDANLFLRGLLPAGSKLKASKSKIVNYAVKTLLADFDAKGKESELVKNMLKDNPK